MRQLCQSEMPMHKARCKWMRKVSLALYTSSKLLRTCTIYTLVGVTGFGQDLIPAGVLEGMGGRCATHARFKAGVWRAFI